jgi:hypothetical protein|tara:strand:+ start:994 stop:1182 length:189 start_codon:yes stop_codon:yes gene_type:complete
MRKRLSSAVTTIMISVSIVGCTTIKKSEIPGFIQKLEQHSFSLEEKETIAEILHYVNDLESR